MRRVDVATPMPLAKQRVLTLIELRPGLRRASEFAVVIWPGVDFKKDGLVRWTSRDGNWGWERRRKQTADAQKTRRGE